MDKVLSVEDFIGGLLKQGGGTGSWKMGLGRRTDSEAAFQEFLKRIPSATALSSQVGEEGKPMFASGSNASLFGFGSSNLEYGGVPRVASLDMLRNMVDQDEKNRSIKPSEAAVQFTGAPEQPAQSPTSLRQQPGANAQLFQASTAAMSHPSQSLAQSAALQASNMPSLPVGSAAAMGGMLQVPGTLLAYQNLPHSPQLLPVQGVQHSMQPAPTSVKGLSSQSDPGGLPGTADEHDKMEQRRARRMLSNRESARRSRKRKQEQLSELETQVKLLEEKNENLESQCQAAAVHVQSILADKQRLENENQHLMSILQQLQKSLGEDTIRKHLPAALGGAGPIPGATRPEGTEALAADAAEDGSAQDGNAAAAPPPIKMESNASEPAAEAAAEQGGSGVKRSLDAAGSPDGGATKTPRTRRDSDSQRQNGTN